MRALFALALLFYPLLVWWGLGHVPPWSLALLLAVLAAARLLCASTDRLAWAALCCALAVVVGTLLFGGSLPLKIYPVLMSVAALILFAITLRHPPSMIERFARLREPELPAFAIAYTRRVTQAWCVFFAANAGVSAWTALYASDALWALYNGLLAYLLMAAMFGGEWLIRRRVRGRHA